MRPERIFVFNTSLSADLFSTTSGKHAYKHYGLGEDVGVCFGHINVCFAIPVLDWDGTKLPLYRIQPFVHEFVLFSIKYPCFEFFVAEFEGFNPKDIAPMFKCCGSNVILPVHYQEILYA